MKMTYCTSGAGFRGAKRAEPGVSCSQLHENKGHVKLELFHKLYKKYCQVSMQKI